MYLHKKMKITCPNILIYTNNTSPLGGERQGKLLCSEDRKCQNLSGKWNTGHERGVSLNLSPSLSLIFFYLNLMTAKKVGGENFF